MAASSYQASKKTSLKAVAKGLKATKDNDINEIRRICLSPKYLDHHGQDLLLF
jgi:hypothetical protein